MCVCVICVSVNKIFLRRKYRVKIKKQNDCFISSFEDILGMFSLLLYVGWFLEKESFVFFLYVKEGLRNMNSQLQNYRMFVSFYLVKVFGVFRRIRSELVFFWFGKLNLQVRKVVFFIFMFSQLGVFNLSLCYLQYLVCNR